MDYSPIYESPARHHYLRHRYLDKNFNVALLAGDFMFGTMAKASDADWQAMKAEGIASSFLSVTMGCI